jgi:hypothetical protein
MNPMDDAEFVLLISEFFSFGAEHLPDQPTTRISPAVIEMIKILDSGGTADDVPPEVVAAAARAETAAAKAELDSLVDLGVVTPQARSLLAEELAGFVAGEITLKLAGAGLAAAGVPPVAAALAALTLAMTVEELVESFV